MKRLLLLLIILCRTLWAQDNHDENMMTIAADHADYQGQTIILTGHVVVEHELGMLAADKMILESRSKTKGISFDHLQMDNHVEISLNGGGELKCSKAVLDDETSMGKFLSGEEQPHVIYRETYKDNKGREIPIVIQGTEMQIALGKECVKNSEKTVIRMITADGTVSMVYDDNFTVLSDRAVFKRRGTISGKELLPGQITLSCLPGRLCEVISLEGDEIQSEEIVIDTLQRELTFTFPKGVFRNAGKDFNPLNFNAKKLVWNDQTSKLVLSGKVEISEQGIGTLDAEEDVRLALISIQGKKVLRGIETYGKALLIYIDPDTKFDHKLQSYGSLRIDHQKMETKLQSPVNEEGRVLAGNQVYFKDAKGEIYADKAFIKYDYFDNKIAPVRIVLQGNVKIANNLERSEKDKTPIEQYILADRVDFIPQTNEMIFKSHKGNRVLLFDQSNSLEVSAPGLKLIRDKATRKETVQGLGDVRFNFVDGELDQIRRHFSFDKALSGS